MTLYPAEVRYAITLAKCGAAVRWITELVNRFGAVDLDNYVLDGEFAGEVVGGGLLSNR